MPTVRKTTLAQLVRFAIVGGFSTIMFLLAQYVFVGLLALPVMAGTTLSFAVSLAVSYFGHHAITFQRSGAHFRYGPRFIVVTALMLLVSNLMAYGMVTISGANYLWSSAVIALVYPAGSFVLQNLWVFAERTAPNDS
jgi:putative flippase GtrA